MQKKSLAALVGVAGFASLAVFGQATAQDDAFATIMAEGETVYTSTANCASCHGAEGQGGFGPELAGNAYLADIGGLLGIILGGFEEHGMPAWADRLDDHQIAAVATYVRNSWGNAFEPQIIMDAWVANRRAPAE